MKVDRPFRRTTTTLMLAGMKRILAGIPIPFMPIPFMPSSGDPEK
jgi:hypothetical protein